MATETAEEQRPAFMDLWSFDDPEGTGAKLLEVLEACGDDASPSYVAQLLTQIARTLTLRRDFDAAHRRLDEAEARIEGQDLPVARLRCLLERGRAYCSPAHPSEAKRPDDARPLYLEAWEVGRERGLPRFALDASHMLGIIEPPDVALEWNLRSIELAEASDDEGARGWLGPLYNNTGWTLHDLGRFDEALTLFEKGWAYRKEKGQPKPIRIAKWSVARALRSLGRIDEALRLQEELIEDWKRDGEDETGFVSEELGECLLALGREAEAKPWFRRAHARLSETNAWLLEEEPERMARLARLGAAEG